MLEALGVGIAWAAGGGGGGGAQGGLGGLLSGPLPMLILMFVIFYFLLIRPQQKKAKAHREMLANLKKGDYVITAGGLYGRITGITDNVVVIEIAPQVRVKVNRGSISALAQPEAAQAREKNKG